MDDMYNKGRNQHTISGMLRDPSGRIVQPQPISYETASMPEDHAQSSFLFDDSSQNSSSIPGGAQTFITRRPSLPPALPSKSLSQPGSPPVPPRAISQKVRVDPSYRLLVIAIVVALLASSVLAAFLATGNLSAIAHHTTPNQPLAKVQATTTARSAQGHTTAPKPTPTPVPTQAPAPATQPPTQPSSNPVSNPPPTASANNLPQFVNLPQQMNPSDSFYYQINYNYITVQTLPGATVELTANYVDTTTSNSPEGQEQPTPQKGDTAGLAVFTLEANLVCPAGDKCAANLIAIAPDGSGALQQITATVPILG